MERKCLLVARSLLGGTLSLCLVQEGDVSLFLPSSFLPSSLSLPPSPLSLFLSLFFFLTEALSLLP